MLEIDWLSDDHCFLCGARLDGSNYSEEHVFPKWLLREAKLWNETAHQLNATLLPYRQCVIPCCVPCNSGPLSSLEDLALRAGGDFENGCRESSDTNGHSAAGERLRQLFRNVRSGWHLSRQDVVRRQDVDCCKSGEVRFIECQKIRQTVTLHGSDHSGVVGTLAMYGISDYKFVPVSKNPAFVSEQRKSRK